MHLTPSRRAPPPPGVSLHWSEDKNGLEREDRGGQNVLSGLPRGLGWVEGWVGGGGGGGGGHPWKDRSPPGVTAPVRRLDYSITAQDH